MSLPEKPLTKADLHKLRRYLDDDLVRRFDVGKKRGLTYFEAYAEIARQTRCKIPDQDKETGAGAVVTPEGLRRLGALNDAYWSAAAPFLVAREVDRRAAKFNADLEAKKQNEGQPTSPSAPTEPAAVPAAVPDAGGAQDLAREP